LDYIQRQLDEQMLIVELLVGCPKVRLCVSCIELNLLLIVSHPTKKMSDLAAVQDTGSMDG
jgi:hypothetical protein